jgi:excisionase family DNA binding protein
MNVNGKASAATERLLTVAECAELGAVAVVSIRRVIKRGELAASKIGHMLRIRLSDWEAFLDSHRVHVGPVLTREKRASVAGTSRARARSAE